MSASLCFVRKPAEDPPDEDRVSDLELAEALFELVEHYAEGWLDVGHRIERARSWRLASLRGYGPQVPKGRVEDDLWRTATLLSQLLHEEIGLKPDDVSTAFDLIGLRGEGLGRSRYSYALSRDRVEAALRRALEERGLDGFEEDTAEESLDFEPDDSLDSTDSSDALAVAA